jgi:acetyl-CoA C-acetyltransferase
MNDVFIINYSRTPIGSFCSSMAGLSAADLGDQVLNEINKTFDIKLIEKGYIGQVLSAGCGQNVGREILYKNGCDIPVTTINNVCGSGMQSIIEGTKSIKLGDFDCIIVGGTESMSNVPFLQKNVRKGNKYGNIQLIDGMMCDGLTDSFSQKHMGEIAELLCEKNDITKEDQNEYSKKSYIKAREAYKNEKFKNEIMKITLKSRNASVVIDEDEEVNKNPDLNKIDKLRSAFKKDGTITAGNASKLSDGACFLVLASQKFIEKHEIVPLAKILAYDELSGPPETFPLLPVEGINKVCSKLDITTDDIDCFEINEAFSMIPIMCHKKLNIPYDKINLYGGAISMGHPLGCSGARIVSTLLTILKNENKTLGCASICNGGGGATSIIITL